MLGGTLFRSTSSRGTLAFRRFHGQFKAVSSITTPSDAVSESTISDLASKPLHPLTLADLVRYGRPPLPSSALYNSANFTLQVLPVRLAHRIRALRSLPFIVVTNSYVAQIHNNYVHSLTTLLPFANKEIASPEDEAAFTEVLAGLVQTHANTIPVLARGFLESRRYISAETVTNFLEEHLRARIGTRLIAEQHIALHHESVTPYADDGIESRGFLECEKQNSSYIGIIDTALRPASVVSQCESFVSEICELNYGVRPAVSITGESETQIAHVPVHLEYIITELLKNSFRATIEQGTEREPIEVTIAPSPPNPPLDPPTRPAQEGQDEQTRSNATIRLLEEATPGVTIRIRDRGGGISPENYANLWNYGFTTFNEREATDARSSSGSDALNIISASGGGGSSLAGLGYGLPLGRAYAEYFGGGIAVQSLWGWGTDVYLTLKGVGGLA